LERIGVVTITYNSSDVLLPFLDCLKEQTYSNFLLYIVDNASIDGTLDILEKYSDIQIVVIKNKFNLGVARANNQGIQRALEDDCTQIMLMNNDVEFESGLIFKLMKSQNENSCSIVTPKMLYYDQPDKIWYAGSWFNKSKGYLPVHRGMGEIDVGQFDKLLAVEYSPTCCCLIKKEVFYDIGFMNESYFVYFDDTDFFYRVYKDQRHKIFYYPFVSFFHKIGSLTKSFVNEGGRNYRGDFFLQQNTINHVYFLKQIGGLFAYLFIFWLFFKNNIQFVIRSNIKKSFAVWLLINKSYFKGLLKK